MELPEDQVDVPSLTDEEIVAIARLARTAEKHYGCPQDIEWAVDDDLPAGEDAVLLQARPETVWSKKHHAVGAQDRPDGLDRRHPGQPALRTEREPSRPDSGQDHALRDSPSDSNPPDQGVPMADRFPSPFDIETPDGAEGWQELYTYSSLFCEERREYEDAGFWFHDGVHWPEALTPWDTTFLEFALASLSQYNTRHYLIPPAYGVDFRILNGYVYLSPVPAPAEEIEGRVPLFMERAGFYFGNWDRLYDDWLVKIRDLVKEMTELDFAPLPAMEDHRGHHLRRRAGFGQRPARAVPPPARPRRSPCGSTTSSSSTWATRPTSTSSGSARPPSRRSPTWPSPRWSPASTSTCSGPTTSSSGSPGWP